MSDAGTSRYERFMALPPDVRADLLRSIRNDDGADDVLRHCWPLYRRASQSPPPGDWFAWVFRAGRGAGKSRAGAEFIRERVESGRAVSVGIVGPTASHIRDVQVEGPSGILRAFPAWSEYKPTYEPSNRRITFGASPARAIAHLLSSEEPDRIRGFSFDLAWFDELCFANFVTETWQNLVLALRVPGPQGDRPQVMISTTPRPLPILKQILGDPTTVETRARTVDNKRNLDPRAVAAYETQFGGTRLGRQELEGELVEDFEGALFKRDTIERNRVKSADVPTLVRTVVAIDPSGSNSKNADECGIIVAGRDADNVAYILADRSGKMSPDQWARRAVIAYHEYEADRVVAEVNFGAAMVSLTLKTIDSTIPFRAVHASRSKQIRAEPVAALAEQNKIKFVGSLPILEDQLCSWEPGSAASPDRLDAFVWAATELCLKPTSNYSPNWTVPSFINLWAR